MSTTTLREPPQSRPALTCAPLHSNASALSGGASMIRILLVDDHPIVRKGIISCLAKHPRIRIVGEARDGHDAVEKARSLNPDVILMDFDMPNMNGAAATELLRSQQPGAKVLILSMHRNSDHVMRVIESGARGYVLKEAHPDELVQAIETVQSGQAFFSPELARAALNQFVRGAEGRPGCQLTAREREVLVQIAEGYSNKEIASRLNLGVRTVETHRERVMRKLNIHSVAGLTKYALSKGLVSLPSQGTE
jgi:two-component system, NarL family, nitrate/nitrite response regulator NarL